MSDDSQSSPPPEEPNEGLITAGDPNLIDQQDAQIPSLYKLRKTTQRRDGRVRRERPPPTKPVVIIIVCNKCFTVFEIAFSHRPAIDDLSAAKAELLASHRCREATTIALRSLEAGA
jgi:hypothetical protein